MAAIRRLRPDDRAFSPTSSGGRPPAAISIARPPTTVSGVPSSWANRRGKLPDRLQTIPRGKLVERGECAPRSPARTRFVRYREPIAGGISSRAQRSDLVALRQGDPPGRVAGADAPRLLRQLAHRPSHRRRSDPHRDERAQGDEHDQRGQHLEGGLAEEDLLKVKRLGELERPPRARPARERQVR